MKLYKKICAGLLTAAAIYSAVGCGGKLAEAEDRFRQEESAIVQTIEKTSPFSQTPVKAELKKEERKKDWYHDYTFAPTNSDDIVYVRGGDLFLAEDKSAELSKKIASNIGINQKYLFTFDSKGKGESDIYWIDNKYNLIKLKNDNGKFSDKEYLLSLKDHFKNLPEHIELGDINSDGELDIIYGGKINIIGREKNAIKALIGENGNLKEAKPVYYLGNNTLQGLIARDVDGDGDSDLIFKLKGNDKELFGLENNTKKGSNPAIFENGFREKVKNNPNDDFLILYWYFFMMPTSPGFGMLPGG